MLYSTSTLPRYQAYLALEAAGLFKEIITHAHDAMQGEVSDDSGSNTECLSSFTFRQVAESPRISLWQDLNTRAFQNFSEVLESRRHPLSLTAEEHSLEITLAIVKEQLLQFKELGFSSPTSLAQAVAAVAELFKCVERTDYFWLNSDRRITFVSRNVHGDMHVCQAQLQECQTEAKRQLDLFHKPDEKEARLIENSTSVVELCASLNQYQDWTPLLGSLLVFARLTGSACIREITEYKEVLQTLNRNTASTAEADFGTDLTRLEIYMQPEAVLDFSREVVRFPNSFIAGPGDGSPRYLAVFHKGQLWFPRVNEVLSRAHAKTAKDQSIGPALTEEIRNYLQDPQTEQQTVRFAQEDLPQALRATYTLFCRDPRRVEAMLALFNQQQCSL